MAETKLTLRLLTDKKSKRVLFAESGKDFVDFLFNLLSLPVSTVTRLCGNSNMPGSIGNLYSSLESLDDSYIQPNQNKKNLLKQRWQSPATGIQILLPSSEIQETETTEEKKFYNCRNNHRCVTDKLNTNCVFCNFAMNIEVKIVSTGDENASSGSEGGGYVRGLTTYMVMDDLSVSPISMISGVLMMNKCNVQDISVLDEKIVQFGIHEGLELLKASMTTKAVLTCVFMTKQLP